MKKRSFYFFKSFYIHHYSKTAKVVHKKAMNLTWFHKCKACMSKLLLLKAVCKVHSIRQHHELKHGTFKVAFSLQTETRKHKTEPLTGSRILAEVSSPNEKWRVILKSNLGALTAKLAFHRHTGLKGAVVAVLDELKSQCMTSLLQLNRFFFLFQSPVL